MRRMPSLLCVTLSMCCLIYAQSKESDEGELHRWVLLRALAGHTTSVQAVAFSPNEKTVASAGWDQSIILWDVETGARKLTLRHGYHPHQVIFSPDGNWLYSSGGDGTIKRWDLQTGKPKAIISGRSEIVDLALSSDGALLACNCKLKTAEVLNAKTGSLKLSAPHGDFVWAAALSPDGKFLAVAGGNRNLPVALWDVQAGRIVRKFAGIKYAGSVAFSPDSKIVAVGSQGDTNIKLFSAITGELLQTLGGNNFSFSQLLFSPDGRLLAVKANMPGRVYFYDMHKYKWIGMLDAGASISKIGFSADSKMLATAGYDDKVVRIWSNPMTN
jgi:WD40 repeat protein